MSATTLGFGSSATGVNSIAIGNGATTSTDNECVFGDNSTTIVTGYARLRGTNSRITFQKDGAAAGEFVYAQFTESLKFWIRYNTLGVQLTKDAEDWVSNSDPRIKKNKKIIKNCCDKLSNIHAWNYDFKIDSTDESSRIGLMSDEILVNFPEAVSVGTGDDVEIDGKIINTDCVRYTGLIPPAIGAINELCTKLCSIKTVEIRDPTSTYIATEDDRMLMFDINVNTTITLPDNAVYKGRKLIVILAERTASQTLTIQRAGSDTIDDRVSTSTVLNALDARIQLVSGGNGVWYVL